MGAERFVTVIAATLDRPVSEVRQRCRAAREAGFLPSGKAVSYRPVHLARLLIAVACSRVADVGPTIAAVRRLLPQSPACPAGNLEDALARLVETLCTSPIFGDLDVSDGEIAIDVEQRVVTWHVRDLAGSALTLRWADTTEAPGGVARLVTVPIPKIRDLARKIT